ncbi:MAG: polyketide synthase dehydratase domain-containing protein [Candidatus Obscuribacterales bacterium]|nr:polyketide synthase dehydratase domain-containing protein [Candidatus Obscuribacterales bacterium]
MNADNLEAIAITGLDCRFPAIAGLSDLCAQIFSERVATNSVKQLQTLSAAEMAALSLKAAGEDAGLLEVEKARILILKDDDLDIDLKGEFISSNKNSFQQVLHKIASLLKEHNSAVVLLALGKNKTDFGVSTLVFEKKPPEQKKVYASIKHFCLPTKSTGLLLSSESTIFQIESDIRKETETFFQAALAENPELQNEMPWTSLSGLPEEAQNYGSASQLCTLIIGSLSLSLKILPVSNNFANNEKLNRNSWLFESTNVRPWIHPVSHLSPCSKRQAAILCTGNNNNNNKTNTLILEETEHAPDLSLIGSWDSEIFVFQNASKKALYEELSRFHEFKQANPEHSLFQLAYNKRSADNGAFRLALIAQNLDELEERLLKAKDLLSTQSPDLALGLNGIYFNQIEPTERKKLAFILPGLGAAYPDMLADLCLYFPEVREVFDFVESLALTNSLPQSLPSRQIFPAKPKNPWGRSNQATLATMDSAVTTVLLAEWAMYILLQNIGIKPDALLGCSTGEFAALTMNGSIEIMSAAETFYKISTAVSRSVPMDQLADLRSLRVQASQSTINPLLQKLSSPSYLGAEMTDDYSLVSGPKSSIDELSKMLKAQSIEFLALPVSIPYHTPLVSGKVSDKQQEIADLNITYPAFESWSCSTGGIYPNDIESIRRISTYLFEKPILFRSTLNALYDNGARIFLEVGPKGGLTPLIAKILQNKEHIALASNLSGRSGIAQLQHIAAVLFCQGFAINFNHFYARRKSTGTKIESPKPITSSFSTLSQTRNHEAVLANYLDLMAQTHKSLMKSQERMMLTYLSTKQRQNEQRAYPFLDGALIESHENGLVAYQTLNITKDLYLLDHAIGGSVSNLKEERVYLLPLMVAIEIMAETAQRLANRNIVRRVKNIRAYKRIRVDDHGFSLAIKATRLSEPGTIAVEIREHLAGKSQDERPTLMSCEIELSEEYLPHTIKSTYPSQNSRKPLLSKNSLYGSGGMFHGPRMRSVQELQSVSERSNQALIAHKEIDNWFTANTNQRTLTDPLLLDNASQLVLFQLIEHQYPVSALLPFYIAEINFFADPNLKEKEWLQGQTYLRAMSNQGTEADIEITHHNGNMLLQIKGINSRAIILPEAWRYFIANPASTMLSAPLSWPDFSDNVPDLPSLTIMRQTFLPEDETALDWCADYLLSAKERITWNAFGNRNKRRVDWLLGRITAKDAVRKLLRTSFNLHLCPADIEIETNSDGPPTVSGAWLNTVDWLPQISISHSEGIAVAIASKPGKLRPGLDIEAVRKREEGFAQIAFTKKEQAYLSCLAENERIFWETRLWTAKEAVAKAVGTGMRGNPHNFEMDTLDPVSGKLLMRLNNWETTDIALSPDHRFAVSTERIDNMALSLALD